MFDYLKGNQTAGNPFIILDKPVRMYESSYEFSQEEVDNLPRRFNAFLVDESKAPYDTVKDVNGQEINNLICFSIEDKNCVVNINGEDQEATHLDYNYFNYPAPATVVKDDGSEEQVRQKWLSAKYRANVFFPKAIVAKVWDKEAKQEKPKNVTHAKVDFASGFFSKGLMDQLETVRETLEEDIAVPAEYSSFLYSFEYDATASPADMYSKPKVKKNKDKVDAAKELEEFKAQRKEFVPPAAPF